MADCMQTDLARLQNNNWRERSRSAWSWRHSVTRNGEPFFKAHMTKWCSRLNAKRSTVLKWNTRRSQQNTKCNLDRMYGKRQTFIRLYSDVLKQNVSIVRPDRFSRYLAWLKIINRQINWLKDSIFSYFFSRVINTMGVHNRTLSAIMMNAWRSSGLMPMTSVKGWTLVLTVNT